MSRLEDWLIHRWSGRQLIIGSLVLGGVGILPLLLYIAFGPADGNPIGLGLLAVVAVPFAGMGLLVGFSKLLVQFFLRRRG